MQAFRKLLRQGAAARRAFDKVVEQQIRRQVNQYCADKRLQFPQFSGTKSVSEFSWSEMVTKLRTAAPTFYAAVRGAMPMKIVSDNEKFT